MKTKDISPIQYAKWYGCHKSLVHRWCAAGEVDKMPYVRAIKSYSRFYTLEVPETLTENDFTEIRFKKSKKSTTAHT